MNNIQGGHPGVGRSFPGMKVSVKEKCGGVQHTGYSERCYSSTLAITNRDTKITSILRFDPMESIVPVSLVKLSG